MTPDADDPFVELLHSGEDDFAMLICWERHGRDSVVPWQRCRDDAHTLVPVIVDVFRAEGLDVVHETIAETTVALAILGVSSDDWTLARVATEAVKRFLRVLHQRRVDGHTACGVSDYSI